MRRRLLAGILLFTVLLHSRTTKGQRIDKICSLRRGFVTSRFFYFIYFTITGVRTTVRYTEDFVTSRFVISRYHFLKIGRWQYHSRGGRGIVRAYLTGVLRYIFHTSLLTR